MTPLEIEVKFYLPDIEYIRNRIIAYGAINSGKYFEHNIRFEDAGITLIKKKSLLRLRKDSKTRLTFKSEPPEQENEKRQFKILKELEVEVGDFSIMKQILESIGFHSEQIYEKWRETLLLGDTELCIDSLPFGSFLEIEGAKEDIINLSDELGLKWEKRILQNYLEIFEAVKQEFNLPFSDLTFDNFKSVKEDISKFIACLEAGK